ncbi:hypothetical protein [Teredinibacter franksiae]|uniref:hypothetical protein n=1 Tax=Teredinibacter franksiae TaxID=2761453 RepID=UPI001626F041|nr:hypothetical protein [Teredinibacter franksiae]
MIFREYRFDRARRKIQEEFSSYLGSLNYNAHVVLRSRIKGDYTVSLLVQTKTDFEMKKIEEDARVQNAFKEILLGNVVKRLQGNRNMYWVVSQESVDRDYGGDWRRATQ